MKFLKALFSWNEIQSSHRLMVFIVLTLGLLNFFWGELVPAGGGFGYDGVRYAEMVRNLDSMISGGQLSSYYAQRILPSAIVRSLMFLSGVWMSDANIIRCFELYNLALLVGACWIWKRVAGNFSLSLAGRWIGFSGIFINFQCSKQAFYYPVLTDVTALFIAMLLLLFYIEKKPIALFLSTIVGAFCWPVVSVCGAFLLIFLRAEIPTKFILPKEATIAIKSYKLPSFVKYAGLAVLAILMIWHSALAPLGPVSEHACTVFNNGLHTMAKIMPPAVDAILDRSLMIINGECALVRVLNGFERLITGLPILAVIFAALARLMGAGRFFQVLRANLMSARWTLVVLSISAVLIPFIIVKLISNPEVANPSGLAVLIKFILLPQEGRYFLPIVSLAVFWGPLVILLVLYWNAFCAEARKLGTGGVVIIGITLFLGMVGEPRFLTLGWPFFVLVLVLALETSVTNSTFKYVLSALTILYAQFWMKFNLAPWLPPDGAGLLEFPKQLYFMHYGLWMSWWAYGIQLILIVLSALGLHRTVIKVGANEKY
jgi:hypothetical protein